MSKLCEETGHLGNYTIAMSHLSLMEASCNVSCRGDPSPWPPSLHTFDHEEF